MSLKTSVLSAFMAIILGVLSLSSQAGAISTRIGNVVECRKENNNGNGLYIKREYCYRYPRGTYGDSYEDGCNFKAYFTAEGGKESASVISSLRDLAALAPYVEKYTNIKLRDQGNVRFEGTSFVTSDKIPKTYSRFYFRPLDNSGHYEMGVEAAHDPEFKVSNFSYTYNCTYIP